MVYRRFLEVSIYVSSENTEEMIILTIFYERL